MDERERHSAGMRVRRAVLGEDHVESAEADNNASTSPFKI